MSAQVSGSIPGKLIERVPAKFVIINNVSFKVLTYDNIRYKYVQFAKIHRLPKYFSMVSKRYVSELPFRFELSKSVDLQQGSNYIISIYEDTTKFISLSLTPITNEVNYNLYLYEFIGKITYKKPSFRFGYIIASKAPKAMFIKYSTSKFGTHFSYQLALLMPVSEKIQVIEVEKTNLGNMNIYSVYPMRETIFSTKDDKEFKRWRKFLNIMPLIQANDKLIEVYEKIEERIKAKEQEFKEKLNELLKGGKFVLKLESTPNIPPCCNGRIIKLS